MPNGRACCPPMPQVRGCGPQLGLAAAASWLNCTQHLHLHLSTLRLLSALRADSVPLPPPAVDMETPLGVRLRLNALLALQVALFCLVHGGLAWLVLRAAAAAPLPTACLVISLAAWLAASVASGSRPHAPQHPSAAAAAPPAVAGAPPEAKAARPRPGAGAAKDE